MKQVYSVRDSKSGCYSAPFVVAAQGEAVRMFMQLCTDSQTLPGQYPDDYTLVKIGNFDDETGRMIPFVNFDAVITGADAVLSARNYARRLQELHRPGAEFDADSESVDDDEDVSF